VTQPATQVFAVRQLRFWLTNYRRTWKGTIYTSVLNPVLYLGAMGLGLGTLVDRHGTASLGGVSYLVFLAPGLQAATATPLRPTDLFYGHLIFTVLRLVMNSVIFLLVMLAFGAVKSPWAIATVPAAVLTGMAFAAPIEAFAITCKKDTTFALIFRFGMIPLFLFSGTFFPVSQLPAAIRPLAYITPLWHGVALCRSLSLGTAGLGASVGHAAYLAAVTALGIYAGRKAYERRLYA
jgi:lipooligosaccharide transport system permease protein